MDNEMIVTVLDYFSGEVDMFRISIDVGCKTDADEQVQGHIEKRGHHLEDCYYMFSESNKFKLKIEL